MDGLSIAPPEPWMDEAVCASILDDEIWYPPKGGSSRQAKKICSGCPVRAECLAYALTHGEHFGVWGGASERDRYRMSIKHPCARCGREFANRHGLMIHQRTHLAAA